MSDRNWDAEMAKIDRQLASVSDDQLASRSVAAASSASVGSAASSHALPTSTARLGWGVAIRVILAVAIAAAVLFWPYPAACGLGLAGYLGAIASVIAAGAWSGVSSWKARAPRLHLLSIVVVVWGMSLAAREVLPRAGYAKEVRTWACK